MGEWCKERYNNDENNKLEGLHQKPDQMEEEEEEEKKKNSSTTTVSPPIFISFPICVLHLVCTITFVLLH